MSLLVGSSCAQVFYCSWQAGESFQQTNAQFKAQLEKVAQDKIAKLKSKQDRRWRRHLSMAGGVFEVNP